MVELVTGREFEGLQPLRREPWREGMGTHGTECNTDKTESRAEREE